MKLNNLMTNQSVYPYLLRSPLCVVCERKAAGLRVSRSVVRCLRVHPSAINLSPGPVQLSAGRRPGPGTAPNRRSFGFRRDGQPAMSVRPSVRPFVGWLSLMRLSATRSATTVWINSGIDLCLTVDRPTDHADDCIHCSATSSRQSDRKSNAILAGSNSRPLKNAASRALSYVANSRFCIGLPSAFIHGQVCSRVHLQRLSFITDVTSYRLYCTRKAT